MSKDKVVSAVLGESWSKTDSKSDPSGGGQKQVYSGPYSNYKDYHDHNVNSYNKKGQQTSSHNAHGLENRDWNGSTRTYKDPPAAKSK